MISAVLLDIEGTTLPVSFVHQVLFPYAREALPGLIERRGEEPAIRAVLEETTRLAPGCDPLTQLLAWMDRDEKIGPLKAIQGIAWDEGYASGALIARLFPDTAPALRAWKQAGVTLAVYSSGSRAAQILIYGHATEGDITDLFSGFYDLEMGGKKDAESYRRILAAAGWQGDETLFLSDVTAELDAAREAGLRTCQIARAEDGTKPGEDHPVATSLPEAGALFGLPDVETGANSGVHSGNASGTTARTITDAATTTGADAAR